MNFLYDTLKYFAKFPTKSAVLAMFNKGHSLFPAYAGLKEEIEALPFGSHSLFPEIKGFIFDVTEETVIKKINELSGVFMFVDYGDTRTELFGPAKVRQHFFTLALTIARRIPATEYDNVERLMISDDMHTLLHRVIAVIEKDSNPFCKRISFPATATPAVARANFEAIGWTVKMEIISIL